MWKSSLISLDCVSERACALNRKSLEAGKVWKPARLSLCYWFQQTTNRQGTYMIPSFETCPLARLQHLSPSLVLLPVHIRMLAFQKLEMFSLLAQIQKIVESAQLIYRRYMLQRRSGSQC